MRRPQSTDKYRPNTASGKRLRGSSKPSKAKQRKGNKQKKSKAAKEIDRFVESSPKMKQGARRRRAAAMAMARLKKYYN